MTAGMVITALVVMGAMTWIAANMIRFGCGEDDDGEGF